MTHRETTPEQGLHATLAVLEGTSTFERFDAGTAKMIGILLIPDADIRVDDQGFFVRFSGRRRESRYLPKLAAPSLAYLLSAARFEMPIRSPKRKLLEPCNLLSHRLFSSVDRSARTVWIYPESRCVRMFIRRGVFDEPPALVGWTPATKVYAVLDKPHACPHCSRAQVRYRELTDVFVCSSCGRSFTAQAELELDIVRRMEEPG